MRKKVMEQTDSPDSGSGVRKGVRIQAPPFASLYTNNGHMRFTEKHYISIPNCIGSFPFCLRGAFLNVTSGATRGYSICFPYKSSSMVRI